MGALEDLKALTSEMLERGVGASGTAAVICGDAHWENTECTRRHVALLWKELNESVTAEIGSALTRELDTWDDTWEPQIVTGEPDDFDENWPADEPYGWLPLAKAHQRESGWDFPPTEASGTWVGWWQPQTIWKMENKYTATGLLLAFLIVEHGDLKFAHTVERCRRSGIASRLVDYAATHHGLTVASGPFTPDGEAFSRARGLC